MKKLLSLIGATGLALIMSFGFTTHQTFAASTPASIVEKVEEVSPYAASRYVTHAVGFNGNIVPPSRYSYKDSAGYAGYIYLLKYEYHVVSKRTTATYAGIVYCQGTCIIPSHINK